MLIGILSLSELERLREYLMQSLEVYIKLENKDYINSFINMLVTWEAG